MTKNIVVYLYEPYENETRYDFRTYTQVLKFMQDNKIHPDDITIFSNPVEVSFRELQGLADEEERGQ